MSREWIAPTSFPNRSAYKEVSIDLETNDPNLKELGSGWARNDGNIIGVAVAVDDGQWYFPTRHGIGPNLDERLVISWLRDVCSVPDRDYVFHNSLYDCGWLLKYDIGIGGRIVDTMVAAPLINENRFSYALNALGREYLGEKKDERDLKQAAKEFGLDPKRDMWQLPATYVGAYAEQDAAMTLRLWQRFKQLIVEEDVSDILALELEMIPIILKMRQRGVRLDIARIQQVKLQLADLEKSILEKILEEYGVAVEIWSNA